MAHAEAQDSMASWAYIAGRRAGRGGLSPSTNPYWSGTIEYAEWERGRTSVATEPVAQPNTHAQNTCPYQHGVTCSAHCGGRGTCLDVA